MALTSFSHQRLMCGALGDIPAGCTAHHPRGQLCSTSGQGRGRAGASSQGRGPGNRARIQACWPDAARQRDAGVTHGQALRGRGLGWRTRTHILTRWARRVWPWPEACACAPQGSDPGEGAVGLGWPLLLRRNGPSFAPRCGMFPEGVFVLGAGCAWSLGRRAGRLREGPPHLALPGTPAPVPTSVPSGDQLCPLGGHGQLYP